MPDPSRFDSDLSEQRFQLLVNAVTDYAIYMLDRGGHVVSWNPGARRFKGYEADEIIGQHYSRFFREEDRAAGMPERALRAAEVEGRFEAEGWRIRKDGTRFWASAVIDPIRDEAGELIGFAKITRDITEKKAAERRLYESEQRFRLLVQGVTDYAIYMLDTDGRVTNWNAGAQAIKGYSFEEIVGEHFSRFYTPEDRAAGVPARALATALAEGKYEAEAIRVRKDGTRFWAHVVIDPIRDDSGRHIGFAKITRDVTERRNVEEELDQARAALVQSQKLQALGELTGGIAHDFNNLITVIRGSAELLRRGGLDEKKRAQYLNAIIETADHATTLTSHLLAFGRRQPLKPEVIDLNVRLDALAEVLSRTLGGGVEVKLDLAPTLGLVDVDSTQLETALLNAAINARDAMPNGGTLTLSTHNIADESGDMVCVALSDTGSGMPKEVLDRAFEPFFTTKAVGKGTGLGLSQIHGFAAQAGGRVEIDSVSGKGTTIRILLPHSHKSIAARSTFANQAVDGAGKTVLLVEDNEQVRNFAHILLTELNYRVIDAESAEQALAVLDAEPVDLVFSDVVMPGQSGVELGRLVRERFPALPVLLASGYSEEIAKGGAGDFDILPKPYGADSLAAALARVVNDTVRQPA
ncbi:PAS domain-containing sensor histidine kinase [Sphingomonas oligophenolica]|uniref:histidine kinase n=1 Tax=Sphingomonas oligophenolica TaxID=301154 RepID=A0ABU9Y7K4_9SPHN